MELENNHQMMIIKRAMMKRILNSQKKMKKVVKMIIKTVATFARRLAVCYAVMDALKLHILLALALRSPLKEIGIALTALKSSQRGEQLVDRP